jgi:glycoside/pentoside/hexuronide:cation symporter, GPH family
MASLPISGRVLLAYGLPGLPLAVLGLPLFIYLPTFYAESVGISLTTIGLVLLTARLWDVVTDPIIGALSDRTGGRLGRRRPWILASLPILCISIEFLFAPSQQAGVGHLLIWSMLLYLGWTMIQLPHAAWGAELSSDYHQRTRITGVREALVLIGTLMAAATPTLLGIGSDGGASDGQAGNREVLRVLALALVVGLPLASLIACTGVPDPPRRARRHGDWRARCHEGYRALIGNRAFLRLIAAYLLNGIANGLPATLFLLFVGHVLAIPDKAGPLLFLYFGCAVVGIPFWIWASARIGKSRAWIIAMAANCLIFGWAPFLGAGDYMPFLIICVLSGICLGADLALPPSMQADVVDLEYVEGAEPRTGLYFALWGMATKLALALAVGISFPLLDLAGFDAARSAVNDEDGLFILAVLYGALPITFKLAAMALMARFESGMPIGSINGRADHHRASNRNPRELLRRDHPSGTANRRPSQRNAPPITGSRA